MEKYGEKRGIDLQSDSFESALEFIRTGEDRTFDMIFLDINMEAQSGLEGYKVEASRFLIKGGGCSVQCGRCFWRKSVR